MSIRLTKEIREKIVRKALEKAGINADHDKIWADREEWAEAARVYANGATDKELLSIEKKILALCEKLPEGFRLKRSRKLSRSSGKVLNVGGMHIYAGFHASNGEPEDRLVTEQYKPVIPTDHPLYRQFMEIEDREEKVNSRERDIRANLSAVLGKATTTKKLVDLWPESKELIPEKSSPSSSNLPAVLTTDLNAMIGLPSEAK